MRKFDKHTKIILISIMISFFLLIISCFPGGYDFFTGILQGLGTGILSGMCLAAINGLKGKEIRRLKKDYKTINRINSGLIMLHDAYSNIYHETCYDKKEEMDFTTYLNIVKTTCENYEKAYDVIHKININFITDNDIRNKLKEYDESLKKKIDLVKGKIKSIENDDKKALNYLRDVFYEIQNEAYKLNLENRMLDIYNRIEQIRDSLI